MLNRSIRKLAVRISANATVQAAAGTTARLALSLSGRGTAATPEISGEKQFLAWLGLQIKQDELTVFDVGANTGQFASAVLHTLGENHRLHLVCFEPNGDCHERLNAILRQPVNEKSRCELVPLAVSSASSRMHLFRAGKTDERASFHKPDADKISALSVDTATLTSIVESRHIQRIDLLKLDIEGHEFDALQGARPLLNERKVHTILFEFGEFTLKAHHFFRDFQVFFNELNYSLFRLHPSGKLISISPEEDPRNEVFVCSMFIALAPDSPLRDAFNRICL